METPLTGIKDVDFKNYKQNNNLSKLLFILNKTNENIIRIEL